MTFRRRSWLQIFSRVLLLFVLLAPVSARLWAQDGTSSPASESVGERSTPANVVPEKREQETDTNEQYRHSKAVAKLGSMVGLSAESAATIFEILNFVVLAIGVGYLAMKTLPGTFKQRNSLIQRHLVDARTATEEASARLNAVEARLSRLDGEIAAMRTHLETETARDEQRIRASVEEEAAKILAAADSEIQAATATARRELQRHAAELAIDHASRRLVVTADTDRELIQGFAQRLITDKGGRN